LGFSKTKLLAMVLEGIAGEARSGHYNSAINMVVSVCMNLGRRETGLKMTVMGPVSMEKEG